MKPEPTYFYTIDRPHRMTSGPIIITIEEDYSPIASLERAKELAEENQVDTIDESRIVTTYGVFYKTSLPKEKVA